LEQRRTNADKRRCVELAIKEFASLSSRAIAELCGVSDPFVLQIRQVLTVSNATRTTSDGRQYPATRRTSKPATPEEEEAMYFEKEDKEPPTPRRSARERRGRLTV